MDTNQIFQTIESKDSPLHSARCFQPKNIAFHIIFVTVLMLKLRKSKLTLLGPARPCLLRAVFISLYLESVVTSNRDPAWCPHTIVTCHVDSQRRGGFMLAGKLQPISSMRLGQRTLAIHGHNAGREEARVVSSPEKAPAHVGAFSEQCENFAKLRWQLQ